MHESRVRSNGYVYIYIRRSGDFTFIVLSSVTVRSWQGDGEETL